MIEHAEIFPLPAIDWGGGDIRDATLLAITTPDGLTGLGSAYTDAGRVQAAFAGYRDDSRVLLATDAETTIAMSAIDIALWDIRGKEQGLPVSELLGGRKRDRVLAYATVDLPMTEGRPGDRFDQLLRSCIDEGFRAIKLCIEGFGLRDDSLSHKEWDRREEGLLAFARKIVGDDVQLMLDVYASVPGWTADLDWALQTASVLEALDYVWLEEPLPPRSFDDFVRLTQSTDIAIAGAEDFIVLEDFRNAANRKGLNILQPDCTRVGGLTQMQAIRELATRNGLHVIPHGWNTAVGLAADLQFQATMAGDKYGMVEVWPDRTITDLLENNPFKLDADGKIAVPTGPGLGVAVNNEFLESLSR